MKSLPDNMFHGKPCRTCDGTFRYAGGQCVGCSQRARTIKGLPCRICNDTLKYVSTNKGVPCRRAAARKFQNTHFNRYGSHLYKRLGITMADYFAIAEAQEWKCKICEKIPAKRMHLDHCHRTMKVRGLLCGTCNKGLGQFKDNPKLLEAAARYLQPC